MDCGISVRRSYPRVSGVLTQGTMWEQLYPRRCSSACSLIHTYEKIWQAKLAGGTSASARPFYPVIPLKYGADEIGAVRG